MSDLFDTALREKYKQYFTNDPLAFMMARVIMVTLVRRVRVKFMFACFGYNVHALKIVQG